MAEFRFVRLPRVCDGSGAQQNATSQRIATRFGMRQSPPRVLRADRERDNVGKSEDIELTSRGLRTDHRPVSWDMMED
jgi:hypothetical protein